MNPTVLRQLQDRACFDRQVAYERIEDLRYQINQEQYKSWRARCALAAVDQITETLISQLEGWQPPRTSTDQPWEDSDDEDTGRSSNAFTYLLSPVGRTSLGKSMTKFLEDPSRGFHRVIPSRAGLGMPKMMHP